MFNIFKKNKKIELVGPITGDIIELEQVSDPVFSEKMLGDGVAILPKEGKLYSPIDGEIVTIFSTNHAIGLKHKSGLEILIHIGIDTVELEGKGFKRLAHQGDKIQVGTPLMEFDIEKIKSSGRSVITPIVITNMTEVKKLEKSTGQVIAKESIIMSIQLN